MAARTRIMPPVLVALALLALLAPARAAWAATDRLPDLAMVRMRKFVVMTGPGGQVQMHFNAVIANVGQGPLEVRATRASSTSQLWDATQVIYDDAGGSRSVPTTTQYVFGGDGHNHWHVKDVERYVLKRVSDGSQVSVGQKGGFCFFDNYQYKLSLPGAPQSKVYTRTGCGTTTSVSLTNGISVGWGDIYNYTLPDQYIDITGLPAGQYRLEATADWKNQFAESNEANNTNWTVLQIDGTSVTVVSMGPNP